MNLQRYFYLEREAKRRESKEGKEGNKECWKKERVRYNKLQNVTSTSGQLTKITIHGLVKFQFLIY